MNEKELQIVLEKHKKFILKDCGEKAKLSELSGYKVMVTKSGFVYSVFTSKLLSQPRRLKPRKHQNGYFSVKIGKNGFLIHRLVADSFLGDVNGMHVHHLDGDRSNNKAVNLEIVTRSKNLKYAALKRAKNSKFRYREYLKFVCKTPKMKVVWE